MLLGEEVKTYDHAGIMNFPNDEPLVLLYIENGIERATICEVVFGLEIDMNPRVKLSFYNQAYGKRWLNANTVTKIYRVIHVEKPEPKPANSTIGKKKSRIEASSVIIYQDEQGRQIQIYYRVLNVCPNAQTDQSRDAYTIEQVLYKGRKVNIRGRAEQNLLEWLNETNPANI